MATVGIGYADINKESGRLGNQLFILAACYAQSRNVGEPCWLPSGWDRSRHFIHAPEFITMNFRAISNRYKHPEYTYSPIPALPYLQFLKGDYYQSEKYFDGYESEIRQMFALPGREQKQGCALHIRGGDYLKLPHFLKILKADYYQRALDHLGVTHFDVYTDDPQHAIRIIKGIKDVTFSLQYSNDNILDLIRLGGYRNIICSNSTFCWWAAYLGWVEGKTIIWPDTYFVLDSWLGKEKDVHSKYFTLFPA